MSIPSFRPTVILSFTLLFLSVAADLGRSQSNPLPNLKLPEPLPPCPKPFELTPRISCFGGYTYADGAFYLGDWRNNVWHGRGLFKFGNGEFMGDQYDGWFVDGKFSGYGTYMKRNGSQYSGEFSNNMPNGTGTWTYSDGSKRVGDWRDNQLWGRGIYYSADGKIIEQGYYVQGEFMKPAIIKMDQ